MWKNSYPPKIIATFLALRDWCIEHEYLQPTRYVPLEEQLAIFLKIVGENTPNRSYGTRTISTKFSTRWQSFTLQLSSSQVPARRQPASSSGVRTREVVK